MHPRAWKVGAILGLAAGIAFLLSDTELVRETIWRLTLLGACTGVVVGIRGNRPSREHPWWLLFGALAILGVANLLDYPLWASPGSIAWSDPLAILAFPLIGVGALALTRSLAPGGDRESAIDGMIVMIAMAAVLAGTAYHPEHLARDAAFASRLLHTVVAPLMMAAVTAATFRLLFVGSLRNVSAWFVVAAAGGALVGNAVRAVLVSAGTYERGVWTDVSILLAYVLIALASLHPSSPGLTDPVDRRFRRFTHARLIVLGISLMAAPATLLARGIGGDQLVTMAATVLVSLLVLLRLSRLAVDREHSRRQLHVRADRQEQLAELGRCALHTTSVHELVAATTEVCHDHLDVRRCELVEDADGTWDAATVALPVDGEGRALVVERDRPFSDEELAFLRSAAHLVTLAIERHTAQEVMRRAAVHDPLTGLPNRRLLWDRLAQALTRRRHDEHRICVMFVDLDDFKRVNDDHGHQLGDEVLVAVARRLEEVVRAADTVGRLAGDEFVIVCEDISSPAAKALAHRVTSALSRPFEVAGRNVHLAVSVGLTTPAQGIEDPEEVLVQADTAMYVAKSQVGPAVVTYNGELGANRAQRRELERELEQVLAEEEFALVYQPLWRLGEDTPIGAEVLLRWDHPERGLLSPQAFLSVAEESDLILGIGAWVLTRATEQLARWQAELPVDQPWTLYVNLSGRQLLAPDLVGQVAGLLDRHGLRADRLGFEVSERAVVDERVVATANALTDLGTRLAWDDFGTGFSSISHLRGWPLDIIKLDGSLIERAVSSPEDASIVRAVCSVAHELGMEVLAEHVSSAQQLATVERLGCDLGQGYHLGPPVTAEELWLPGRPRRTPEPASPSRSRVTGAARSRVTEAAREAAYRSAPGPTSSGRLPVPMTANPTSTQ